MAISDRGMASLPKAKVREIAAKGGRRAQALGVAHKWTSETARAAAYKAVAARRAKQPKTEEGA